MHLAVPSITSKYGQTGFRRCRFLLVGVGSTAGCGSVAVSCVTVGVEGFGANCSVKKLAPNLVFNSWLLKAARRFSGGGGLLSDESVKLDSRKISAIFWAIQYIQKSEELRTFLDV